MLERTRQHRDQNRWSHLCHRHVSVYS